MQHLPSQMRAFEALKFFLHVAKECPSVKITRGADVGRFVWDVFVERVNKECDLSRSAATNFSFLFTAIYQIRKTGGATSRSFIVFSCCCRPLTNRWHSERCCLGLGKVPISTLTESVSDNLRRSARDPKLLHVESRMSQTRSLCFCSEEKLWMSNTHMRCVCVFL